MTNQGVWSQDCKLTEYRSWTCVKFCSVLFLTPTPKQHISRPSLVRLNRIDTVPAVANSKVRVRPY